MPSPPRGRNAATIAAVVLAVLLALVWLRSSGGGGPSVPVGLPVAVPAAAVAEPAGSARLEQGGGAEAEAPSAAGEGGRAADPRGDRLSRHKHADRAAAPPAKPVAGEDARARRQAGARIRRGSAGEAGGQDPPATAPAPAGSGTAGSAPPAAESPPQPAPEFAIG